MDAGEGSDEGAVHIHLTRTERWQPPFDLPTLAEAAGPGAVDVSLGGGDGNTLELRFGARIGEVLGGEEQLNCRTNDGATIYLPLGPEEDWGFLYTRQDHLIHAAPVAVTAEFVIGDNAWTPLAYGVVPTPIGSNQDPVFRRLEGETVSLASETAVGEQYAVYSQSPDRGDTCTVCLIVAALPDGIGVDGYGRAFGYHSASIQQLMGWESASENHHNAIWGAAVTPDLAGRTIEAVGVSPTLIAVLAQGVAGEALYTSSDGASYNHVADITVGNVSEMVYAQGASRPGWFALGPGTAAFVEPDGTVTALPNPPLFIVAGHAIAGHLYAVDGQTKNLYHLDVEAPSPHVWFVRNLP